MANPKREEGAFNIYRREGAHQGDPEESGKGLDKVLTSVKPEAWPGVRWAVRQHLRVLACVLRHGENMSSLPDRHKEHAAASSSRSGMD